MDKKSLLMSMSIASIAATPAEPIEGLAAMLEVLRLGLLLCNPKES